MSDAIDIMSETLVTLTADIVSAHVSNNSVAVSDLPMLIANVHGALTALGGAPNYEHGKTAHVTATISIGAVTGAELPESESTADDTMELLSNEEIEALFHLNQ